MKKMNHEEDYLESGVDVRFQRVEAETEAEAYENGLNTVIDHFDEDEMFKVHLGYKAWYVIGDNLSRLSPGTYRYHDGQMQINLHGEWKRYRHDEEDF